MTYDRKGQNMEFMQRKYILNHILVCAVRNHTTYTMIVYAVIYLCFSLFILKINNINMFLIF